MRISTIRPLLACVLTFGACGAASAQNVLRLPDNRTVEVIGLEDWTVPMLQDSLRRYADGVTLDSHACAAVLRQRLGFAMASATTHRHWGEAGEYVLVSVVEPADSARVRRRRVGDDTVAVRPRWAEGAEIIWRRPWVFQAAMQQARGVVPPHAMEDSAHVRRLWAFWDAHAGGDSNDLLAVLRSDPNMQNRAIAASLLAQGPASEEVARGLVSALLDDRDFVATAAGLALRPLAAHPRSVDWGPAAADVHALLDGSNLFELDGLMVVLLASGADGRWAAPFLAGGGHALLARMDSENPRMREIAHRLLVTLRGEDLGQDAAAWRVWVASLGSNANAGE